MPLMVDIIKWVFMLWKAIWKWLKRPKIELPFDPAIPLLGISLKEMKVEYEEIYTILCLLYIIKNSQEMKII